MENKNKRNSVSYPFLIDSEATGEMPGITKLLNRKKLGISSKSDGPVDITNAGIRLSGPAVHPAKPRERRGGKRMADWTPSDLRALKDPLCHAIANLIDPSGGCSAALFLAAQAPARGAKLPSFLGAAAMAPHEMLALWTGISWKPESFPYLWNSVLSHGFAEISPQQDGAARAVFGCTYEKWIALVQVGSAQACHGVLLLLSEKSLADSIRSALPALTSSGHSKAA